jgi:hypothetical protein
VITIRDSAGNTVANSTVQVTVAVSPTSGIVGGSTTVNAVNGVATFTGLTLAGTVNTNYVLTFSATGLASATANSVTVTPGTATQLAVTTQPVAGASAAGLTTQPVVTIRDAQGNTVTSSTATVTVALQSGTGGTLGGSTTANAVNGVATFSGVTLAGAIGTSYTLRFTSLGLTPVDSGGVTPSGHGGATQLAVTTQPVGGASGGALQHRL